MIIYSITRPWAIVIITKKSTILKKNVITEYALPFPHISRIPTSYMDPILYQFGLMTHYRS